MSGDRVDTRDAPSRGDLLSGVVAQRHISGQPVDETVVPLAIASAEGPYLVDMSGRRYLDWASCLNVPFGHSFHVDTDGVPRNAGNYATVQRYRLVAHLGELFPSLSGFQFRSSGTESVEGALRYVTMALGDSVHLVSVADCYHGLSLGARGLMQSAPMPYTSTRLPFPNSMNTPALLSTLERIADAAPVAIFLEGVQGATLRRLPRSFLDGLARLRSVGGRHVAIVCDDMLASIRCGAWCSIADSIEPDVLIGGKSWSGGYPFSFFGIAPWLRQAGGDLLGTTTYGGNPVSCVYADATITALQRHGTLAHVRMLETTYALRLAEVTKDEPQLIRTEWHGLLFGLVARSPNLALRIARHAAGNGLLVAALGSVIRCSPPLNLDESLLEDGLDRLLQSVRETLKR